MMKNLRPKAWRAFARTGMVVFLVAQFFVGQTFASEPPFDYIIWDGHRFAQTPEQVERDFRYFKDLGFTHTLLRNADVTGIGAGWVERMRASLEAAQKYQLDVGLRFSFQPNTDRFAKQIGLTRQQMIDQGILLNRKDPSGKPAYNPVHPAVIRHYTEGFTQTLEQCLQYDTGKRLRMFLIGTEMGWPLPKKAEQAYPEALKVIFDVAQKDGVQNPTLKTIGSWWAGPHQPGGDWRLRKSIEAAFSERVSNAQYWVDPIWAVKIVNGFGGTWSYISSDPKGIADGVLRLKAMTRPAAAAHSTQLIRGAYHDTTLEANLLAICIGADKLYHWGVHTFEPGHLDQPFYRYKGEKTEEVAQQRIEQIIQRRLIKEPAIRTTGRLIRDRGELFRDWKPMQPRVAVLGGVYSPADFYLSLMVGHIPFDILRNEEDRRANLASYRYAVRPSTSISEADYADLLEIEKAGGGVFVREGFKAPEGKSPLNRPVQLSSAMIGSKIRANKGISFKGKAHELRAYLHDSAREVRKLFHDAGFRPYFDSDNFDIVMQGYTYKDIPMLFVVNDLRAYEGENRKLETKGLANDVDILIRDQRESLRVINIDTGKEVKLDRRSDGWHISDTLEPAWYRIYAVLSGDQSWSGSGGTGPLPAAPAVQNLKVARHAQGMRLSWRLPIDDWVGCDVQWYKVFRGGQGEQPTLLKQIYGRILNGPGGVVTEFIDETAKRDGRYTYQVQAISPLRRPGPISAVVGVQ